MWLANLFIKLRRWQYGEKVAKWQRLRLDAILFALLTPEEGQLGREWEQW